MGAPEPFKTNADFTGINDGGLCISKVVHKAVVEVNEVGTEAAAATAVVMLRSCVLPSEFKCDRPFVFIIHDNQHHTILFIGKLENPNSLISI
jgi:serine protease inhibitor